VAVRNRYGTSELVRVHLATGAVTPLFETGSPTLDVIYYQPRVSPDGERIAVVRHRGEGWDLVLIRVADKSVTVLPTGLAGSPAYPSWSGDGGSVFISAGKDGFVEIFRLDAISGGPPRRITRTLGASLAPEPASDGSRMFFLALKPDGYQIRTIPLPGAVPAASERSALADLAPAVTPEHPGPVARIEQDRPEPGTPYGAGRQELRPILGWDHASHAGQFQLGVRGGDVLGRSNWLVLGSTGSDAGPEGVAAAGVWNGWPVTLGAHLYWTEERPSAYEDPSPAAGDRLDLRRQGVEIQAGWDRKWDDSRLDLATAVLVGSLKPPGGEDLSSRIGSLTSGWTGSRRIGSFNLSASASLLAQFGETENESWKRYGGRVWLELGKGRWKRLRAGYSRATAEDASAPWDRLQLGGMESSILPRTLNGARMFEPAFPAGHLIGDDYEGRELILGPLFYRDHQVWVEGGVRGDRPALAGLEFGFGSGPRPILRLPGLRIRAGAARVLNGPLDGDNRFWVNMVWRP
jgi:hypothetical protein